MKILKILGWLIVPYVMLLVNWNKLGKAARTAGAIWSVIAIIATIQGQMENKGNPQQATATVSQDTKSDSSVKSDTKSTSTPQDKQATTKEDTTKKNADQPKTTPQNDFQPKHSPEVAAVARKGGLGDTFDQLQNLFGKPTRTNTKMSEGFGQYNYQDDNQVVMFTEGRVSNIAYQLDHKNNIMTEKQAREFALTMMPSDSTFIKQYDKDENIRVLLYHSKTLESLFDASEFDDANGNPQLGQFDIVLTHNGDQVGSMGAMLGDNP